MAAAAGLSGLFALNTAIAAPPPGRQFQNFAQRMDLSAPLHPIESANKTFGFRSLSQRPSPDSSQQIQLAPLQPIAMRSEPTLQDQVRRVRQDGFPVARLWETSSALVHLGFNQKGKPGLWVIQKIH